MRAGLLDRKLTIQQRASGADATYGGVSAAWSTFATVWGQIHELTGREFLMAGTTQAQQTVSVTIRYLSGLSAAMRIQDDHGRILQIVGISMQGRRAYHVLQCTEFNQQAA